MNDDSQLLGAATADQVRAEQRHRIRPETIQHLEKQELVALQGALGFGTEWGCPEIPLAWVQPGKDQAIGARKLDFAKWLKASVPEQELDKARLMITRFVLLHWLVPRLSGKSRLPAVATWQKHLARTAELANIALQKSQSAGLFDRLTPSDFEAVWKDRAVSAMNAWKECAERGLFSDVPVFHTRFSASLEHDRHDEPSAENADESSKPFTPFPDEFIAELGWRVLWFVEQAGPVLLDCAEKLYAISDVGEEHRHRTAVAQKHRLAGDRNQVIAAHDWTTVQTLPFDLHFLTNHGAPLLWPPRTAGAVKSFLSILQSCHVVVLLLSLGSRSGETHSLRRTALVEGVVTSRVEGRTYKLVFREAGAVRDWPLPDLGAHAVKQQCRLADVIKLEGRRLSPGSDSGDNLWVRFGHGEKGAVVGDELRNPMTSLVRSLTEYFGIQSLIGSDTRIHAHRFRKTLARLVALAVAGSPKILMDLFGHKTIEMTLSYILADKALRAEVEEVAKAQTLMFAEHAIENAHLNGGPAARALSEAVAAAKATKGEDEFGVDDIKQLAEVLTLGGRTFQMVRPGVLCTKQIHQVGPCNKHIARPEPSRCRSTCLHRLEDAAIRDDVDGALKESVAAYEIASTDEDEMQCAVWAGQIRANLPRFEDVRLKWSAHPTVARLLAD